MDQLDLKEPENGPPDQPPSGGWLEFIPGLIDLPLVVVDRRGTIRFANPAWHQLCADALAQPPERQRSYLQFLDAGRGKLFENAAPILNRLKLFLAGGKAPFRDETAFFHQKQRRHLLLEGRRLPGNEGLALITHTETTAQQRAYNELRESHSLFRHVLNQMRDGVFLYDLENRLVLVNRAFAEAFGRDVSDLVGKTIYELYSPDAAKNVQEQNILLLTTRQELNFEVTMPTPQGDRKVVVRKSVYTNHHDEVSGVFGIGFDAGQSTLYEGIARSERHFRALIENSSNRVALLERDGKITYSSPSSRRMVGFEIDDLLGSNAFLWVNQDDMPGLMRKFNRLLENPGGVTTAEYRTLCKDGSWTWMEATYTNLLEDPNVRAIVLNERDISERKEAEFELTRYARIVESSNEGIIGIDTHGRVNSWNPAAETIFGYSAREMFQQEALILVPSRWRREYSRVFAAAIKGKSTEDLEIVMRRKDKRPIHVQLTLSPVRDRERLIIGVSIIARDITERRRLEKEILEIADREKQRLGQDLHDDLCQHLVGISLICNMLHDDLARQGLPQKGEADRMRTLVNQAIDHARRLARGLCPLQLAGSGFIAGVEMLVANTEQLFRAPCRFESEGTFTLEDERVATHLYRITQEALHNAVKHSQASEIVVRIHAQPEQIEITVTDNGTGFSGEPQPPHTHHPHHPPSGLGMHTMRYRASFIGASLEFANPTEGGTRLTCRLPLNEPRTGELEA